MPQWGIAMAASPYRSRHQLEREESDRAPSLPPPALAALARAKELAQTNDKVTDVERMYIAALDERKKGIEAYITGLRSLIRKYPAEIEARTYLALMLMRGFVLPEQKPRSPESMEAVAILRALLKEAPDHPGVHHYVLHAWEGSSFAEEARPSCERYVQLVTNIPHALHMPGHIYSQIGEWNRASQAFEAAAENERRWMKADSLYAPVHHGHNLHYLATAYAFGGDFDKAMRAVKELLSFPENPRERTAPPDMTRSPAYQGFFAQMRTLVQFRKWDVIIDPAFFAEPARVRPRSWFYWARAIAHAELGNVTAARTDAETFQRALDEYRRAAGQIHPSLDVGQLELDAHLRLLDGDWRTAKAAFEKAMDRERSLRYNEPPDYPRPVAEALGYSALKKGDLEVAQRAFRSALEQYPADWHAQEGIRNAQGKKLAARK